ncbi:SLC25A28, partial [Lemmus lemmus]
CLGGVPAGPSGSRRPRALWAAPEADATGPGGGSSSGGGSGAAGRRGWPEWMELEGRSAGGVAGGPAAGPGRSPGESALLDGWLQRGVGRGAGGGEAGACQPPVRQDPESGPEYEALPAGATVTTHMVAGAVAGILEHCVMYPVDCVKTRMQSLQPDPAARYRNVLEALWRIIRTEGLWRPMRGLNVTATGAGPAHALYFACYEKLKKTLSDVIHPGGNSHIANGIEPSCAGPPLSQLSGLCCCQCFPVSAWFGLG